MENRENNSRIAESEVDKMFIDRWSPRSFLEQSISDEHINSLFEAAKWAPSCYNEQPWEFYYAKQEADKNIFLALLSEQNKSWASKASLIIILCTKKHFTQNNKTNRHAQFDAGAAWLSLALQARKLGLYAHAMAGFDVQKAYQLLDISEDEYDIMAMIAVGIKGDNSNLNNDDLIKMEQPNSRKSLKEITHEGIVG